MKIVTYKDFQNLQFPLFRLPSENWHLQDGVLFLDGLVLDEKNMPGETLGVRRIQCGRRDLHPLKKAVMNVPQLLKCATKVFIDTKGKPFVYQKTYSSSLRCYRIKRIERKESASLLWLHGVNHPFKIDSVPRAKVDYARVLHLGEHPWMLYDYVVTPTKDTYRRV